MMTLRRRARLSGVTVHVLRHSFAAAAAEMGFSELTIAGLLGHSVPGVNCVLRTYPRSRASRRRGPGVGANRSCTRQ
jgi:hypothetical protein